MKKNLIILFLLFILLGIIIGVLLSSCNDELSTSMEVHTSQKLIFVSSDFEWTSQNGTFNGTINNMSTNFTYL